MRFQSTLLLAAFSVSTIATAAILPRQTHSKRCGVSNPPPAPSLPIAQSKFNALSALADPISIDVYFHVVVCFEGDLNTTPDTVLQAQFTQLYEAYAPHNILWNLKNITRTVYSDQCEFNNPNDSMELMKNATRRGTYATANVWFLTYTKSGGAIAIATFPELNPDETTRNVDGVMLKLDALPGSEDPIYEEGDTLVHELGHWLNLYHPFQGNSCDQDPVTGGDLVADTPTVLDIDENRDVCPEDGVNNSCIDAVDDKPDPIHNYMMWTSDACIYEFTDGQVARMKDAWATYRAGK